MRLSEPAPSSAQVHAPGDVLRAVQGVHVEPPLLRILHVRRLPSPTHPLLRPPPCETRANDNGECDSGRLASFLSALVAGAAVAAALISILARLFGQVADEPLVISTSH